MRARQAGGYALIVVGLLANHVVLADDKSPPPLPGSSPKAAAKADPAPSTKVEAPPTPAPTAPAIPPATEAEVNRERLAMGARISSLGPDAKEKPALKPILEILDHRKVLLDAWMKVHRERLGFENPNPTPESEAAAFKAELEKTRALLDQSSKSPDALLPEVFQAKEVDGKIPESRLGEMKEAIDAARNELKELTTQVDALRAEGTSRLTAQVTAFRVERDKVFQEVAGLNARRAERQAGLASAASPEARELARDRLTNFEWETRVESERLALVEAEIALAGRRLDLAAFPVQAKSARVQFVKRLAERMEARYASLAERQRNDLKQAGVKEENRAAHSNDPLERRRAQRTAELFELESQVVAYEKAYATHAGLSLEEQSHLADATKTNFASLKSLLDDGNVSPLDALRLKNDFRRIVPERAQIVRTDLATSEFELTSYENALTDAEIDLVNDSRDDRFDRESILDQLPPKRRDEANAIFDDLEARHKGLLNRRRNVLEKLARRADDCHAQVLRRIQTLDEQYAFIRTHIFWIRDAEPLGAITVAHARDDSFRAAKAVARLALETTDRGLWTRPSADFILALAAMVLLPLPLWFGQKALDRVRVATAPDSALGLADFAPEGIEG